MFDINMRIRILTPCLLALATVAAARPNTRDDEFNWIENLDEEIQSARQMGNLFAYDDHGKQIHLKLDYPTVYENNFTKYGIENIVHFTLHTREKSQDIYVNNITALKSSGFDPNKETRFVTHGWVNSKNSPACTLIRNAYLQQGNYNVIVVDWSSITIGGYVNAVSHVKPVGKYVAQMIVFLQSRGMDLDTTTLVGHSLGAHVMGLAAYYSPNTINYVVGLDPALPLFLKALPGQRISTEGSNYVEIIHTNAGKFGYDKPLGHADFYPNGGKRQIGCLLDACSHSRSYEFFAESITSDTGFYGKQCKDYRSLNDGSCNGEFCLMGGLSQDADKKGIFYLKTKSRHPYAYGKRHWPSK